VYPAPLGLCTDAAAASWTHDPSTAHLVSSLSGACMDVRESDQVVGIYACGSGEGLAQANQAYAVDATTGTVLSLFAGNCLTAV